MVHTERLNIVPLDYMELVRYIGEREGFIKTDEDERKVYEYTVQPMLAEPKHRHLFYTIWLGYDKQEPVVECGFLRPVNEHGVVEIWTEVKEDKRGKGYGTEAINGLSEWAKTDERIKFIGASVEPDNDISKAMLTKCGFLYACDNQGMNIFYKTLK